MQKIIVCYNEGITNVKIPINDITCVVLKKRRKIMNPRTGCNASITIKLNMARQ